jgi:DNA-binding MarR family transcriptional regulator
MLVLWESDGLTVSQAGERLDLDSGTLTPLLKRLESAGLLHRQRDTVDERRVMLWLTDAGRQLRQQASSVPPTIARATGCSVQDIDSLRQALNGLRERLLAATAGPPSTPTPNPRSP